MTKPGHKVLLGVIARPSPFVFTAPAIYFVDLHFLIFPSRKPQGLVPLSEDVLFLLFVFISHSYRMIWEQI